MIEVQLVDKMGDDLSVANCARVSFNKWKEEMDDKDVNLLNYLAQHKHTSPFRHVFLSVRCKAPIFLARQLAKHQVGLSWNEVSRRYVDFTPEFYYPEEWRKRPKGGIKQGSGEKYTSLFREAEYYPDSFNDISLPCESVEDVYEEFIYHSIDLYEEMIAKGVAPEMARMILPQSMMTEWIWSGSLQAFFHMWALRSEGSAQIEAQDFAEKVGNILSKEFPNCFSALIKSVRH